VGYCSRAQRPTRTTASVDYQQQQQFQQPASDQKQQSFIYLSVYLSFLFACGTRLLRKNLLSYSQFVGTYDKKTSYSTVV
jgi:uncharacterized protein YqiB (DUF1249 family)